jgi:ATP-binding cassette, subfamily C, bacterial CydCD
MSRARGCLLAAVALGLAAAALILAQAGLLATVQATAVRCGGMARVWVPMLLSLAMVAGRAVLVGTGQAVGLRAAAIVKSQLRRSLAARALRLGPAWD